MDFGAPEKLEMLLHDSVEEYFSSKGLREICGAAEKGDSSYLSGRVKQVWFGVRSIAASSA